ncbi:MAG TPA: ankyrin repeat domain-containing protein [Burkholderiaceae bacterium]
MRPIQATSRPVLLLVLAAAFAATVPAYAKRQLPADARDEFFHDIEIDYASGLGELLELGFDPNTRTDKGQPALSQALIGQSLKAAKALWESPRIEIDARNDADETPLMLAALKSEADACAALLARGAAVNKAGWSPLHYAATGGNAAIVRMLVAKGAAIEARSPNGTTPLMMAAMYGSEEAVDALLAAGASRSAKNDQGLDASAFAARAGRDRLAARLKADAS